MIIAVAVWCCWGCGHRPFHWKHQPSPSNKRENVARALAPFRSRRSPASASKIKHIKLSRDRPFIICYELWMQRFEANRPTMLWPRRWAVIFQCGTSLLFEWQLAVLLFRPLLRTTTICRSLRTNLSRCRTKAQNTSASESDSIDSSSIR